MKTRIAILIALVVLLLLGGVALGASGGAVPSTCYIVQPETLSGGGYHLTNAISEGNDTVSGGGYHLSGLSAPRLTGNGCCCTYLPMVVR